MKNILKRIYNKNIGFVSNYMTLMLALETLGLCSCSINWSDIEHLEKKKKKALNLDKYQSPLMCMAIGYPSPDGMIAYSEKISLDEIRKYN